MRKYFVKDNDGNLSWFEASQSGLENAIQFAQNNKANVETFVDWQEERHDKRPLPYPFGHLGADIVWEFKG